MNKILFIIIYIFYIGYLPAIASGNADGPYLLYNPDGSIRCISVSKDSVLTDTIYKRLPESLSLNISSHDGKHTFTVGLHTISRQAWKQYMPEKLLVISDPHGNMDCFVSFLRGNGVINEEYKWIYGNNHLMIIGDVFDRGKDVLPIFWLIYKLEKEAEDAGGQVSFLLGNHESLVLSGDYRYMDNRYKEFAERIQIDYRNLFGPSSELGRWLLTRNTLQIIGQELFVHAGLSKPFLELNLEIHTVNTEISRALFMTKTQRNELSLLTGFLFGNNGPIWYRGMVRNDEKYNPLHYETLYMILEKYMVKRIIVGHTIFPDIKTFYAGKVIDVNVDNKKNFQEVSGRGVLMENGKTFIVNDKGIMSIIDPL